MSQAFFVLNEIWNKNLTFTKNVKYLKQKKPDKKSKAFFVSVSKHFCFCLVSSFWKFSNKNLFCHKKKMHFLSQGCVSDLFKILTAFETKNAWQKKLETKIRSVFLLSFFCLHFLSVFQILFLVVILLFLFTFFVTN